MVLHRTYRTTQSVKFSPKRELLCTHVAMFFMLSFAVNKPDVMTYQLQEGFVQGHKGGILLAILLVILT